MTGFIMPLATLDEIVEEHEATLRALDRLADGVIVDRDQMEARRGRLEWWERRLREQREQMEAGVAV